MAAEGHLTWQERAIGVDDDPTEQLMTQLLSVVRRHLGMDVAFVGRVTEDGRREFEFVDADPWFRPVNPGQSDPLEDSYCGRVLSGRLPSLIADATQHPGVTDLPATWQLPVGAHLSVPIVSPDGRTYGTLCCFSRLPDHDRTDRDVEVLRMFADVVGTHLEPLASRHEARAMAHDAVTRLLDEGGPATALQPIVSLATGMVTSYEALARFPAQLGDTEDWFRAATFAGLGTALETAAVHGALTLLPQIPAHAGLAVNVSATALLDSSSILAMLTGPQAHRLVVELTEHQQIGNPERLNDALARVRAAGGRVAVDDAGSGYAGLERILTLRPEVLKLDRSLVHGVAQHPGRQAMCLAMVGFTRRTGAELVAEGVETTEDLEMLRRLGVSHAQGYLLGRPSITPHDEPLRTTRHGGAVSPSAHGSLAHSDVSAADRATAAVAEASDGLEQVVRFAELCRLLAGPAVDSSSAKLVATALRLHRESCAAALSTTNDS